MTNEDHIKLTTHVCSTCQQIMKGPIAKKHRQKTGHRRSWKRYVCFSSKHESFKNSFIGDMAFSAAHINCLKDQLPITNNRVKRYINYLQIEYPKVDLDSDDEDDTETKTTTEEEEEKKKRAAAERRKRTEEKKKKEEEEERKTWEKEELEKKQAAELASIFSDEMSEVQLTEDVTEGSGEEDEKTELEKKKKTAEAEKKAEAQKAEAEKKKVEAEKAEAEKAELEKKAEADKKAEMEKAEAEKKKKVEADKAEAEKKVEQVKVEMERRKTELAKKEAEVIEKMKKKEKEELADAIASIEPTAGPSSGTVTSSPRARNPTHRSSGIRSQAQWWVKDDRSAATKVAEHHRSLYDRFVASEARCKRLAEEKEVERQKAEGAKTCRQELESWRQEAVAVKKRLAVAEARVATVEARARMAVEEATAQKSRADALERQMGELVATQGRRWNLHIPCVGGALGAPVLLYNDEAGFEECYRDDDHAIGCHHVQLERTEGGIRTRSKEIRKRKLCFPSESSCPPPPPSKMSR